jgi:hypothetical protein
LFKIVFGIFHFHFSVTFGMTSSDSFFHTQAMQGVFITPAYQQIAAVADLWGVSQIRLGLGLDLSLGLGFIIRKV